MANSKRARPAAAFGRGGIDETLMGAPRVDVYKSTGDTGMVRKSPSVDSAIERQFDPFRRGRNGMRSMKKGGKVRKTGPHLLHKGEKVVPKKRGR